MASNDQNMRLAFKYFNKGMLLLWRLGLGPWINMWPAQTGRIMVLAHRGRKTGQLRHSPVNYCLVNGGLYCTAGFGAGADWYRNLMATPDVEVWLPDGWWSGRAEDVTDQPDSLPILRQVLVASGFAARWAGIDALGMSDAEIRQHTEGYRLVHIRRTLPRTGPGGPGDLSWVWMVSTLVLGLLQLTHRRRGRRS
ncbi:MAG: nitroreductase family deazaflavin-dependent oxidoreductase [Anaerolineaceae bacterium]|nr:nitroreductase family deazaflavin-dependent oxidoreductase [Anaerolineaceae bacterium]